MTKFMFALGFALALTSNSARAADYELPPVQITGQRLIDYYALSQWFDEMGLQNDINIMVSLNAQMLLFVDVAELRKAIKMLDLRCVDPNGPIPPAASTDSLDERLRAAQGLYDALGGRVREGVFSTAFRAFFGWARGITVTYTDGATQVFLVTNLHASLTLAPTGKTTPPGSAPPKDCANS